MYKHFPLQKYTQFSIKKFTAYFFLENFLYRKYFLKNVSQLNKKSYKTKKELFIKKLKKFQI